MEFSFDLGGDLDAKLAQAEASLAAFDKSLQTSGKSVDELETELGKLEKMSKLASIDAMSDPLKKQAAAFKLAVSEAKAKEAADAKLAKSEAAIAKVAAEQAKSSAAAKNAESVWLSLGKAYDTTSASTKKLEKEMQALERQEKLEKAAAIQDPTKQRSALLKIFASDVSKAGDAQKEAGKDTLTWGAQLSQIGNFLLDAGSKALDFAKSIVGIGESFVESAINAKEFNTDITEAFDASLGGPDKAAAAFRDMTTMADKAGLKVEDVGEAMRGLAGVGFKNDEINTLISAGADIGSHMGGGQAGQAAMQKFEDMAAKIRTVSKVSSKDLVKLGEMGINPEKVLDAIAKLHNTTRKGAELLMQKGAISGTQALDAVLNTVQAGIDKGQAIGTAALQRGSTTVEGAFNRLHDKWHDLLSSFDEGPIGKMFNQIVDAIDGTSASGKKLQVLFKDVFDTISGAFSSVSGSDVTNVVDGIVDAMSGAWAIIKKFAGTFEGTLVPALRRLEPIWDKVFGGDAGTKKLDKILDAVGTLAAFMADDLVGSIAIALETIDTLEAAWGVLADAWTDFKNIGAIVVDNLEAVEHAVSSLFDAVRSISLFDIGKSIVDGLEQGIEGEWDTLVAKVEAMADKLPQSVRKVLGIASPSKVMHGLGQHTAAGFALGVESGDAGEIPEPKIPQINSPSLGFEPHAPQMQLPPVQMSAPGGGGVASAPSDTGGGSGKSLTMGDINVTVNLGGGGTTAGGGDVAKLTDQAKDAAQEFGKQLRAEFARSLVGLGIEVGGAG